MKTVRCFIWMMWLTAAPMLAQAQTPSAPESAADRGVDLDQVIDSVAKKTSKKFIVDPRVRGSVTVSGANALSGDYAQLLGVLEVHGFAAVESGGFVRIVPDASARYLPVPTAVGNKQFADGEIVTKVVTPRSIPAPQLVPMLRPMLPQAAHLAAFPCTNTLVIVDRFANVKRIEGLVDAMDKGEPLKPRGCAVIEEKK